MQCLLQRSKESGINGDGYLTAKHLLEQVDNAINILEGKADGKAQELFLFDNSPSHQKRADDAQSARRKVPKGTFGFSFTSMGLMICHAPSAYWTHTKSASKDVQWHKPSDRDVSVPLS